MAAESTTKKPTRRKRGAAVRWTDNTLDVDTQHHLRREAIFRTAVQMFNEIGFHAATLDDIASRLNVSKPTLYYYTKNKEDILFECQRMAFLAMKDALDEAENGTQSGMQKLTDFLKRYAELMSSDMGACLIRTGLKPFNPENRAKMRVFAKQLDTALQNIIRQGIADRSIRECDPKMTAFAIFGGFNGIAHWYRDDGELSAAEISDTCVDLFAKALAQTPTAEKALPAPKPQRKVTAVRSKKAA